MRLGHYWKVPSQIYNSAAGTVYIDWHLQLLIVYLKWNKTHWLPEWVFKTMGHIMILQAEKLNK